METTKKSGIVLKKTSVEIAKYKAIKGPGVYEVYAGSNNWIEQKGLDEGKFIVNLKAVPSHKVQDFLDLFKDSDEIAIEDLKGLTMTANIPVNNGRANVPMKNQLVKIMVDFRDNADKTAQVLCVTAIEVPKALKGSSIFSDGEVEEESSRISATADREQAINSFDGKKATV
jgi:hypothetical protein